MTGRGAAGFDTSAVAPDAPDVVATLGGVLRGPNLERDFANLYLKLAELRGRLTPGWAQRWADIKAEHVRQRWMGGAGDDPVTRLVGTLSGLGVELGAIRGALGTANPTAESAVQSRTNDDPGAATVRDYGESPRVPGK